MAALRPREDALDHATDGEVDVLVIGGGITGAGVALDAATRGYRVALVERDDLASGTSSKSSKLVHGGIRYLANADLPMVAEGVRERDRMRRNAPHLVRPLGFVIPVGTIAERAKLKAGMELYDALAAGRSVRPHTHLDGAELGSLAPSMGSLSAQGAYRYYDAQTDDARLTLFIAQMARVQGADVVNHAEVVELLESGGRVVGARVRDRLSGAEVDLRARWTVSASGVWAGDLWSMTDAGSSVDVVPAKGSHITLPAEALPVEQAIVIPSGAGDGRMNFVIPWGSQTYVGTTDEVHDGTLADQFVDRHDVDYLLGSVNAAFGTSFTAADGIGAWSGLRPLLKSRGGDSSATKDLSRKHQVSEGPNRLVTVTGGKLTTWRQMAEDVVDHLVEGDGLTRRCVTANVNLGAHGSATEGLRRTVDAFRSHGQDESLAGSLYHRHGDRAGAVLERAVRDGEADVLVPGLPYLVGEVRHAVEHELARTLDDVLQRRLRVSLRDAAAGGPAIDVAAGICADLLGWDADERQRQVDDYLANVRRERGPVPIA